MATFDSAVGAVRAAVAIQQETARSAPALAVRVGARSGATWSKPAACTRTPLAVG